MRAPKLPVFILCLILIGVTAKEIGFNYRTQPRALAREADSAESEFQPVEAGEFPVYQGNLLERGEVAFAARCSSCHTTGLVWQSGLHAEEIDSTVTAMLAKDRQMLESAKQELLVHFLESRFPRN